MKHLYRQAVWTALVLALLLPAMAMAGTSPKSLQHYRLLQEALTQYRALAAEPSRTALPPLPSRSVADGQPYSGANTLRKLLLAVGDISPNSKPVADTATFDIELVEGLKRFQRRHQLDADGVLGPATWRALTTPLSQRVLQIERTLMRWDQLPDNPGTRAIFINIPQFKLLALRSMDDRKANILQIDVVVGKDIKRLQTPAFVADMTHLIFRPYWDVPRSIATRELIPQIRAHPEYLANHHLEIVSPAGQVLQPDPEHIDAVAAGKARLRQRPGPDNALGQVKFVLPNGFNVYLHDTPAQTLFKQNRRAYSHGCVRVAEPSALAEFVLQGDPAWTPARIKQEMTGSEPLRVDIAEPIRVYFVYGTALALESGEILFFDDIYNLDAT
jgi:L,D-transpeptidase YcbB